MSSKQPSRVVFVGNIPYGLSEEQIIDLFSTVGKVLNFRLVYDPQTGKTRGYGFAEYPDIDSASSAVRNLHDHEVMGRKLRVDFSNERPQHDPDDASATMPSSTALPSSMTGGAGANNSSAGTGGSSLPPLPSGSELPPGVTITDSVSRTLNAIPPDQLLHIIVKMQELASKEPHRCTELLAQAPQLSYAVFQALLLMGLVSPEAIHSVIEPSGAQPYTVASAVAAPPTSLPVMPPAPTNTPPAPYGVAPSPYGIPAQAPAPAPAPVLAAGGQDPEALMKAVMELPQATIDQLPEAERQQIMALRASFAPQRR
jgi:cleavage stimulation factor subunit 2